MPQVPTYDSFQVAPTVNPEVRVVAPEYQDFASQQQAKMGAAMLGAGAVGSRIAADMQNTANAVRVDDAINQTKEAALALTYDKNDGFTSIKGQAALDRASGQPLAVEYKKKLSERISQLSEKLGNDSQRQAFALKANDLVTNFYGMATAHETKEFTEYTLSVQEGKLKNASNAIVLDPLNTESVRSNIEDINNAIYTTGKTKGLSAEQITAAQREALSQTHMNVVKSMLEKEDTDGASAYFKEYSKQMSGVQVADAQKMLNQADNAKVAISTSNQLWSEMGPKSYNEPVDIYKMEQKAREMFPDSPTKSAAVITELRNRKAAFDSSESEFVSANVNAVGKLMQSGKSLNQIKASPEFNALPGAKQNELSNFITDRNHMLWARSGEDQIRMERDTARKNIAAYFDYTDPTKLAGMKRDEVAALFPKIGIEHTANLLQRWDSLQNKDALLTSKMDAEQFNAIANQFNLNPFEPKKSEAQKAELGTLHNNINGLLEQAAKEKRQPLTREEKENIMRKEMAKTVTVGGMMPFGLSDSSKPIAQLSDEERKKVVVPPAARLEISAKMAERYKSTQDPMFAPTEDNLRNWYLLGLRK